MKRAVDTHPDLDCRAIDAARAQFGPPGDLIGNFSTANLGSDVLRSDLVLPSSAIIQIMAAARRKIHRPRSIPLVWGIAAPNAIPDPNGGAAFEFFELKHVVRQCRLAGYELHDPIDGRKFTEAETDIAFAAVRVAYLVPQLERLGLIRRPTGNEWRPSELRRFTQIGEVEPVLKRARKLRDALEFAAMSLKANDALFLEGVLDAWGESVHSIEAFTMAARSRIRDLETTIDALSRRKRTNRSGSAREHFVRDHLFPCFRDIFRFRGRRGASRRADQTLEGPFVRFASEFFKCLGINKVSDETVVRAASPTPAQDQRRGAGSPTPDRNQRRSKQRRSKDN